MYTFNLTIIRPDGQEVEQSFSGEQTSVGRHESSDLRLLDSMVSRNHCIIIREGKRFVLKDLDSRNGSWVNGRRIKNRRTIKHGDIIQVGPFRLLFSEPHGTAKSDNIDRLKTNRPAQTPFGQVREGEQVVKPIGMIHNYLSETAAKVTRVPTKVRRERLNRNLLTLYRITEQLVTRKDLEEILEYIMDQIFEIFTPSQTTILLTDKDQRLVPIKQRSTEGKRIIRPISNTIVNRVLKDRVAILTDNALEDPRFEMGQSVIVDGIRSVMAAPIWEERTILGVLYTDSLDVVGGYQTEDLDLLTAIGHQTALAMQRWKLTEKLREEAVKTAIIRQNLKRFHPEPVLDLILQGRADLEAKEAIVTVLFCDIVEFTSLCETINPKEVQAILNSFFKTVNKIIFEEHGTLDKFIGDAVLAIFGAPIPQVDAPVRAVRAALRIRAAMPPAMAEFLSNRVIRVRYGINTGEAVVGNFGSDERMEYTVLGHSVNLASRICKAADPDAILIGQDTFRAIEGTGLFRIVKAGSRALKGFKGTTKLYEVEDFA